LTLLKLSDILEDPTYASLLDAVSVVCIEELQFFEDAYDIVLDLVNKKNKRVVVAGLVADYTGKLFGDVGRLIPFADDVHHIKALCSVCNDGTPALFTQRISTHSEKIAIGAKDMYRAVCRKHYYVENTINDLDDGYQVGYSYADICDECVSI
jgi:thymidine kinase